MISFSEFILERFLNPGFNEKHEHYREQHRQAVHDILRHSYKDIGGYMELGSGTDAESKAIHGDISNSDMKLGRKEGKIVSATLYKKHPEGRKVIAAGTDGSEEGKKSLGRNIAEDIHRNERHAWGEFSGALGHIWKKSGARVVPSSKAHEMLHKVVEIVSPDSYKRLIGGKVKTKTIMGNPKNY